MKFEVGANSRLQNIVWKYGFAAWTSPYGTKMAVKRMSSFAPCWAQRRNTRTKEIFIKRNSPLAEFILDEMWMSKLSYQADIFRHLNKLNRSLQGFCTIIFALRNKTGAFKKKLVHRDSFVQKGETEMFPTSNDFFDECWR